MLRFLYWAGASYVAICAAAIAIHRPPAPAVAHPGPSVRPAGDGAAWFAAMKPYCNAVEVETAQHQRPAPTTVDGAGYSAACYSLAGKLEQAHAAIDALGSSGDRRYAAEIVFGIGHPVADAGDDKSAGPIMELVLDYDDANYMALYHAGMSEYALGQPEPARRHLQRFLELYRENDGWVANAREVLGRIERGS